MNHTNTTELREILSHAMFGWRYDRLTPKEIEDVDTAIQKIEELWEQKIVDARKQGAELQMKTLEHALDTANKGEEYECVACKFKTTNQSDSTIRCSNCGYKGMELKPTPEPELIEELPGEIEEAEPDEITIKEVALKLNEVINKLNQKEQ